MDPNDSSGNPWGNPPDPNASSTPFQAGWDQGGYQVPQQQQGPPSQPQQYQQGPPPQQYAPQQYPPQQYLPQQYQPQQQPPQGPIQPSSSDAVLNMMYTISTGMDNMRMMMEDSQKNQTNVMQGMLNLMGRMSANPPVSNQGPAAAPMPAPTVTERSNTKLREPRQFNGKAVEVEPFIDELENHFRFNPSDFRTDERRIIFASSYLKDGDPRNWYNGLKKSGSSALTVWKEYVESLKLHFQTIDVAGDSYKKLRKLAQTGSAAAHIARFNELAVMVDISSANRHTLLMEGLKPELRKGLVHVNKTQPYNDLCKEIIRVDNELHELEKDTKTSKSKPHSTNQSSQQQTSYQPVASSSSLPMGEPMQIDATKTKAKKFFKKLTQEEKDERKRKGLCSYCGMGPHSADDCPNKSDSAKKADAARAAARKAASGKA